MCAGEGTGRDGMEGNKLQELRELIEFLKAKKIAELDMEREDLKVRCKFASEHAPAAGIDMAQLSRLMASAPAAAPVVTAPVSAPVAAPVVEAAPEASLHMVKSPIVGTF